ncbi:DUF3558 family protein [Amycolatopsis vancoresmycina]|uniref:DUF3558 domain-containing protein n=1 Tax=Amycolatopsis vancoresmycina DSM 44592 TaxID=1292037 RepID=R1I3R6_9PSEU|nr:DUF3558 family protein [Amycolatopsis vancoresmycina]EOD67151.1 hypothetical protein H480_17852 [Amycolatopsis vancoresmycina DSM 44592]
MTKLLVRIILPLVVGGALLGGCTTTKGGTASPAQSPSAGESKPSESTSSGGGGTQSITDPCSLLEMGDLSSYGQFDPPENGKIGSARACTYQKQIASASDKSMVIGANVRDNASIDQVRDTGRGVVDKEINGRKAKESPDGAAPGCTLALAVGDSSRVDVEVTAVASSDEACQVAEAVAKAAVEPRLPKG